jgi:GNAT superfamily N-acetyltransferase
MALASHAKKDQVIGFIAWSKSMLFVSDAVRFHIEGLIVDKDHRGQGVGKKLMLFVEEISKSSGPAIIDLLSGIRRQGDGSHEFYKALGYKNEGPMAKLYFRKEF